MNNKNTNNKDKKKLFILILLLFVVIGLTGYGAYSYFYTSGSFSGSDTVDIASFDPVISGDFLGNGGTLTLSCPDSSTGNDTVYCTGTVDVTNNGGTAVTVSTSDASADYNRLTTDDVSISLGDPTFSWTNSTITAGSTETLTVSVPVYLSSDFGTSWDSEYRSSAYLGEAVEIYASFKINAAQVHD